MHQITVDRRAFGRAMTLAQSVVSRSTLPVLECVRATANGALALESTDLDMCARAELAYTGDHAAFMIPTPRTVMAAINAAGNAPEISFTPIDHPHKGGDLVDKEPELAVRAGLLNATLKTQPVYAFPQMESIAEATFAVDLGATELRQIARIIPAISTEETRYYLNGVAIFRVGEWDWRFVATDGHRLMMVDIPLPGACGTIPDGVILPRQFVTMALHHFRKAAEPVRLSYGPRVCYNEAGVMLDIDNAPCRLSLASQLDEVRFSLTTKLIDGNYPDYTKVVPGRSITAARMNRAELARAIGALSVIGAKHLRAIALEFAGDHVVLSCQDAVFGRASIIIACENNVHAGVKIGFNARYLLSALSALNGDEVTFGWDCHTPSAFAGTPCLITDPADTAFRCVVMPMRL